MKNKKLSRYVLGAVVLSLMPIQNLAQAETELVNPGWMSTQYIDDRYILDSSVGLTDPSVAAALIETYINKVDPKREGRYSDDLSNAELANMIAGASYCFEIDPFVLTALIRKESIRFNQYAKSYTHAQSYTQFTSVAALEVHEQLGIVKGKALKSTISYLRGVLTGTCLAQNGGFKTMGANYRDLWTMEPASHYERHSELQAIIMKNMMPTHPEYAIVYGALLLKMYYAVQKTGASLHLLSRPVNSTKAAFSEALMLYNGDKKHPKRPVAYQHEILDIFYPAITGVPAR